MSGEIKRFNLSDTVCLVYIFICAFVSFELLCVSYLEDDDHSEEQINGGHDG